MSYLIATPVLGNLLGQLQVRCTGCGEAETIAHDATVIRHDCSTSPGVVVHLGHRLRHAGNRAASRTRRHHPLRLRQLAMSGRERTRAALTGQPAWGQHASTREHKRYLEPAPNRRRKCRCGCGGRITHYGCCNGLAMAGGCERHPGLGDTIHCGSVSSP